MTTIDVQKRSQAAQRLIHPIQPIQPVQPAAQSSSSGAYVPNVGGAFDYSQQQLQNYYGSLQKPGQAPDLTTNLENVGSYQPWQWEQPDYNAPTYEKMGDLTTPEMERTTYTQPQIGEVQSVAPMSEALWTGQETKGRENIAQQYKDTQTKVMDELRRTRNRPEQAAALLANLGVQQEAAQRSAQQEVALQKAQQNIGIGQQEQQLNLQRGTSLASIGLTAEQAQAAERQNAAQYGLTAEQAKYGAAQGENRYAYEAGTSEAQYQAGLQQWQQEQQAAEAQTAYQSQYALAQDVTQAQQQQFETQQAANYDYANAMLQGQQAASQQASQLGTYFTNLPESQQKKAPAYQATGQTTRPAATTQPAWKSGRTQQTYKAPAQRPQTTKTTSSTGGSYG